MDVDKNLYIFKIFIYFVIQFRFAFFFKKETKFKVFSNLDI